MVAGSPRGDRSAPPRRPPPASLSSPCPFDATGRGRGGSPEWACRRGGRCRRGQRSLGSGGGGKGGREYQPDRLLSRRAGGGNRRSGGPARERALPTTGGILFSHLSPERGGRGDGGGELGRESSSRRLGSLRAGSVATGRAGRRQRRRLLQHRAGRALRVGIRGGGAPSRSDGGFRTVSAIGLGPGYGDGPARREVPVG